MNFDNNFIIPFEEIMNEKSSIDDQKARKLIIENASIFAVNEEGSKAIQKIYNDYPIDRDAIFNKIFPDILNLSKTEKGNYVIQKIIECDPGNPDKRIMILNKIKGHIKKLSIDDHGTYIIQKLIENIQEEYLNEISKELEGHYYELIIDKNGNRVVQNLIKRQCKEENDKIYEEIKNDLIFLSKNIYGCRVIQELLNNCNEINYYKIFQEIFENINELIEDKSGNYLIQFFLDDKTIKNIKNLEIIYQAIKGHIYDFSLNKHSVYIIEKVLELGNELYKKSIINELLELDNIKKDCLTTLTKDQYGNHIVKMILKFSDMDTKKIIIEKILSDNDIKNKKSYSSYVIDYVEELNVMNNGIFEDLL